MVAEVKPIWSHVLRTGELNDDIGFSIRDQEGDQHTKGTVSIIHMQNTR